MSLIDFKSVAAAQAVAWKSTIVGEVGPARIKVLCMDALAAVVQTRVSETP